MLSVEAGQIFLDNIYSRCSRKVRTWDQRAEN